MKKTIVFVVITGALFLIPVYKFMLSPQAQLRYQEVIIHNRRINYGIEYLRHYFDNLSFQFLFIKGDGNPKFSTQAVGQMYIFELPFLIAGIFFLFRKREGKWWLIPVWLLLSIVPATTARETPHALRIETALPTFQVLTAYGITNALFLFKRRLYGMPAKNTFIILIVLAGSFNFLYFVENYFIHYPKEYAGEWQYGYKDAISYIETVEDSYDTIHLTKELGRPYAYMLFYKKYDPKLFREQARIERSSFGFVTVKSFDKYFFDIDLARKREGKSLYIVTPVDVPKNADIEKTFYLPNGKTVLVAYSE